MQDIHDIRPPVLVGIDPGLIMIALAALGGLLILFGLFLWYRKWRKKSKGKKGMKLLPKPLAPYESAIQALDTLLNIPAGDPRVLYFDLTLVLRKYMGDSFGTHAIEMTSQEFISSIRKLDLDEISKTQMLEFYRLCDPYKYAGAAPESSKIKDDIESVRQMVTQVENQLKAKEDINKGEA